MSNASKDRLEAEYQAIVRYLEVAAESEEDFRNKRLELMLQGRLQELKATGIGDKDS